MALRDVDRTVVISPELDAARLAAFWTSWDQSGWANVLPTVEMAPAVDGMPGLDRTLLREDPVLWRRWATHLTVLRQAQDDQVTSLAVFEDGAMLPADSDWYLEVVLGALPYRTAGLWLDATTPGDGNRLGEASVGTSVCVRPPLACHGYIVSDRLIDRLVPVLAQLVAPVDRMLAWSGTQTVIAAATPSVAGSVDWSGPVRQRWAAAFEAQRSNRSRLLRSASVIE